MTKRPPRAPARARRRLWWPCLIIGWAGAAATVGAAEGPAADVGPRDAVAPFRAAYKARVGLIPAWVNVSLQPDADGLLTLRSEVRGRGWASPMSGRIVEISRLRADGPELQPVRYEMHNGFSRKDRDIVIRFSGDGTATSVYRGEELRVRADPPPVDLLTLRLVLSSDLARNRLADEYAVVDGKGRLQTIGVTDTGEEPLETGAGLFATRRLEYAPGTGRHFVIWLAPALNFQMVGLEQYEDGELRGRLELHGFEPGTGSP